MLATVLLASAVNAAAVAAPVDPLSLGPLPAMKAGLGLSLKTTQTAAPFRQENLAQTPLQDLLPLASFSPAYFDVLSWPIQDKITDAIELEWGQLVSSPVSDIESSALVLDVATLAAALASEQKRSFAQTLLDDSARIVDESLSYLGIKYRWGGSSPEAGFDCSGLVKHVFASALGLNLPRTAQEMAKAGEKISKQDLLPGDLVFFNTRNRRFSHVGIHIGGGKFVHAPRKGKLITIASLSNSYWKRRFNGAVRIHD